MSEWRRRSRGSDQDFNLKSSETPPVAKEVEKRNKKR
jgi:hypothetical protein